MMYEVSERGLIKVELGYELQTDRYFIYEPHSKTKVYLPDEQTGRINRWIDAIRNGFARLQDTIKDFL